MMGSPELLVWAEALVAWSVINYSIVDSSFEASDAAGHHPPTRQPWPIVRLACAALGAIVVGWVATSWILGLLFALCSAPLVVLRARWADWRMAERELVSSAVFACSSLATAVAGGLHIKHSLVIVSWPGQQMAVAGITAALFAFTVQGGTYLVRSVLRTSGVPVPDRVSDNQQPSTVELKRGRLIGALERAVLFVVLVAGSYEALGFIVAAKGLIRSRDLEDNRDLTEYFLIGP